MNNRRFGYSCRVQKERLRLTVAFALGLAAGYVVLTAPFQWDWFLQRRAESLGALIGGAAAAETTRVYEGTVDLDDVLWSPPNAPAPFVGTAPVPGRHRNGEINAQGFRHAGLVGPKPKGTYRIFLTGGSTAFGSGASSQRMTVAGVLEERLSADAANARRYEVVTSANPSWASSHERILIENTLSELEPDVVISLSGNNDVHWGMLGHDVYEFHTYQEQYYLNRLDRLRLLTGHGHLPRRGLPGPVPVPPETVALRLVKNATLAAHVLGLIGARYLFALQPTMAVTKKALSPRERTHLKTETRRYFRDCYQAIEKRLAGANVPNLAFIDLSGVFDGLATTDEIFIDSYHFGDSGNRIVARSMGKALRPLLGDPQS